MKRLLFLLAFLLFSVPAFAATGDITAIRICGTDAAADARINTWTLEAEISGATTGGTYAFGLGANNNPSTAKIVLTVTSNGYDTSGNATTITRTVIGTQFVRKPYNSNANADEVAAAGTNCAGGTVPASTTAVRVALSDYIYASDTVTAVISSGFYTGTVSNNAYSGAVTNSISSIKSAAGTLPRVNSAGAYPKSVCRWVTVPYQQVSGNFTLEVVCFNRHGLQYKPEAAVVFTITDTHSNTVTGTVNVLTKSTAADVNPVYVYAYAVDVTSLTQGDVLTANFKAYPWVGDSGSVVDSSVTTGDIVTAALNAGGVGYAVNDTGYVNGCGSGQNAPVYKVLTLSTTAVATFSILSGGTGCSTATGATTSTGGAQPGLGTGFTINTTTWVGVAGHEELAPLLFVNDKTGAYGSPAAYVDGVHGHNSTADTWFYSSITNATTGYTSSSANSYTTISNALQACKTYNNDASATNPHSWSARNNLDGCHIEIINGTYVGPAVGSGQGAQNSWAIIEAGTGQGGTQSGCVIGTTTGGSQAGPRLLEINNCTMSGSATFLAIGATTTDQLWLNNLVLNSSGAAAIESWQCVYATYNTVTALTLGFSYFTPGTKTPYALIRGNTGNVSGGMTAQLYAVVGNSGLLAQSMEATLGPAAISDNSIWAYNVTYAMSAGLDQGQGIFDGGNTSLGTTVFTGFAFVQNIAETKATGAIIQICAGDSPLGTTCPNVMVWYNTFIGGRTNMLYNYSGSTPLQHTLSSIVGNIFASVNIKSDVFATNAGSVGNWGPAYNVGSFGNRYMASNSGICANAAGNNWNGMFVGLYTDCNGVQVTGTNSSSYVVKLTHTSASGNKPITGGSYATDWTQTGNVAGDSNQPWVTATSYDALLFTADHSYSTGDSAGCGSPPCYTFSSKTSSAIGLMPSSYDPLEYDIVNAARNGSAGAYEGNPLVGGGGGGGLTTLGAGDRIYWKDWRR